MALTTRNIRRASGGLAAVSILAFAGIAPASAEESTETGYALDVELTENTTCVLTVTNQSSVHPDTDVEVTVGDNVYVLSDVESEADKVTVSEPITIGDEDTSAYVRFGSDGKSSLASEDVNCEDSDSGESDNEDAGYDLNLELTPGTTCVITIRNQFSVHPDTDVEVTVGDDVYVLSDVEGEADKVTVSDVITIGDDGATVFVRFGSDGKSSLSSDDVSCEAPAPDPVVATPTYTG